MALKLIGRKSQEDFDNISSPVRFIDKCRVLFDQSSIWLSSRGEPRLELGVHRLWNYVDLFWNSLINTLSSIVFYLAMKVEVGVHDIRSRTTPRLLYKVGRELGNFF